MTKQCCKGVWNESTENAVIQCPNNAVSNQNYCELHLEYRLLGTTKMTNPPPDDFKILDSGKRQEFTTGSVRDTQEGKGRFDLISPVGLLRLARHYEGGALKYDDRNWEKGQPLSRYLASAYSHLNKFLLGCKEEDHLAAAAWNIFGLIHTQDQVRLGKLPAELDDLPEPYISDGKKVKDPDMCQPCGGSGNNISTADGICPHCKGLGRTP